MPMLSDYKTDVANKGFDAITQDTAITGAINAARRRILNERRWAWMRVLGNDNMVTISPGQKAAALGAISDLLYVDAIRLVDDNGVGYDLTPIPLEQLRDYQTAYPDQGIPQYWACVDGASPQDAYLWPIPSTNYNLDVDYVKTAADMVNDGDIDPVLPAALRDAVAWGACVDLSYRMRDQPGAQSAQGMFNAEVGRVASQELGGNRQRSKQIRKSGQWDDYEVVC